jgi:hypothetical protein
VLSRQHNMNHYNVANKAHFSMQTTISHHFYHYVFSSIVFWRLTWDLRSVIEKDLLKQVYYRENDAQNPLL